MKPMTPLRIGVLSFAHYHANFWSEVFAARQVLEGIWDDDSARGREAADRFGTSFDVSLDALLPRCNAVAICSETSRHAELIEAAALERLAILCEKPLGTSLADCERIAGVVEANGAWFMQSFPKRFDPATQRLQRVVASRELGRITLARIRHGHFYGLQPDFSERWYVRRELAGGGALLDEGVHAADLLALLFGLPHTVIAETSHDALDLEVEDLGIATFRWSSGLIGEIVSSFTFAAADTSIELYGSKGTLILSGVDLASRDITERDWLRHYSVAQAEREWRTVDLVPGFKLGQFHQQNATQFVNALQEGRASPISIQDGVNAVRMIDAAYRSAQSGMRVEV